MQTVFIHQNQEYGIESRVNDHSYFNNKIWINKFIVSLRDIDADQVIDSFKIFKNENKAIEYAKSLTA